MGPAHVALAWRQVAWVSACVASGATDGWGPRARVAKQKKKDKSAPGGIRARDVVRARKEPNHWATVRVVMDLCVLVVLR